MFKQILDLLPADPSGVVVTTVVAIALGIGTLTALLGALHSRVTMAILMLAIGAGIGQQFSQGQSWQLSQPAIPIGVGAIVLGLLGYLLHRFWVSLHLGILVGCVALFVLFDQTHQPTTRASAADTATHAFAVKAMISSLWQSGSPTFRSFAPWVGLGALAVSGVLGYCFPRFGMALLYSLGGTLLTLAAIRLGHASDQVHWLDAFRTGPMTTVAFGFCLLLVGFLTQIALLYREPREHGAGRTPAAAAAAA